MGNCCSFSFPCDAIATRCWDDCIRERAMYIYNLEDNLVTLNKELQDLKAIRDDVVTKVNIAEQQQLKRLNKVQSWLSNVAAVETEAAKLIRDGSQEIERLCLGGYCSKDCKSSYKFAKRVAKKLKYLVALKTDGDFKEVAETVLVAPGDVRPSDPAVGLESTFDKLWSCLQDKQVGNVGLYGIGGVGKTTLLTQINNKLLNIQNGFDVVIWIVVSKDLNVGKIQENIGEKIGFSDDKWKYKSFDQKATDIFRVLSQKKFVLLLDDMWEKIDLTEVGIPHSNIQNGCKIVFTTRSEEVCYRMNVQKKIRVECLAWEKAWELFKEKVGEETLTAHPYIHKLAEIVAKECGGLPLALITIGRAMAGKKTPERWRHAIEVLRRREFTDMGDEVFSVLKFSYDNLRNDKVRSCFLYCALFPEDFSINKGELIDHWIGEGILDRYEDRREAENEGYDVIGTLLQASLLEDVGVSVKMHDVIRDLALWIANNCGEVNEIYLVRAGAQLSKPPEVEGWEGTRRVSLMANRIEIIREAPNCPNLLTLFLNDNHLRMITRDFFDFMPSLRVLDMSGNHKLLELPMGISKLVSLEYLNLSSTAIQELPIELKTLVMLKYLNLETASNLQKIPCQLISSFSKLQVLKMSFCCYHSSIVKEDNILSEGNELLVEELQCLKHLNVLTFDIKSDYALQRFLSFKKLQTCTQKLLLYNLNVLESLNVSSLANMKCLKELYLEDCESLKELKIDWASEGGEIQVSKHLHNSVILSEICFDSLHTVNISNCSKLADLTWLILAPNVAYLKIYECEKIEEIINVGEVPELVGILNPFSKLEELILFNLPELKSIYGNPLPFLHLKKIEVFDCLHLKKLPLNSNSAKEHKIVIHGRDYWWERLEWEDEATQNIFLHCFDSLG